MTVLEAHIYKTICYQRQICASGGVESNYFCSYLFMGAKIPGSEHVTTLSARQAGVFRGAHFIFWGHMRPLSTTRKRVLRRRNTQVYIPRDLRLVTPHFSFTGIN